MVPNRLEDWTLDAVTRLLETHVYENDRFDWKLELQHVAPTQEKDALVKAVVAFANGEGGFLVFGVRDERKLPPVDRIVGVAPAEDLANTFWNRVREIDPNVPWRIGSPIALPGTDRVVVVVEVLASAGPHSFRGTFYRRVGSSSAPATTTEVRTMFRRSEEVKAKAQFLVLEIIAARETAILPSLSYDHDEMLGLRPIDTRILAQMHAELATELLVDPELVGLLLTLRAKAERFNFVLGAATRVLGSVPQHHPVRSPLDSQVAISDLIDAAGWMLIQCEPIAKRVAALFALAEPKLRTKDEVYRFR